MPWTQWHTNLTNVRFVPQPPLVVVVVLVVVVIVALWPHVV
jgi:hypothetical protein